MAFMLQKGMSHYYILKKGVPAKVSDLLTWAHWFDTKSPDRIVEKTTIGDVEISTVFFGLDASSHEPPRIYRTLVNPPDMIKEVYATLEEAQAGHEQWCASIRAGI